MLLFWLASFASAQDVGVISGRILDAATKEALVGVNVVVLDTNLGAATDADGNYIIERVPVGVYRIKITYLGYEPVLKTDIVVRTARPVFVNAEMEQTVLEGEAVVVTAGYFGKEEQTAPSTIALTREEIRRFPGGFEDVVRTVSTLPGVAINMTAGRNDLLVRGGGPSENLYLINNIEVPNINHFGTQGNTGGSLSFVNLDFVDDVAFSTGGFGARFGDKMSSVIDLTMVSERPEGLETKGTISATQFGFDLETPLLNRGSMIFSARKSYLDFIFKAAGLPFVPVYTDFNVLMNLDLSDKDRLFVIGLSAVNNIDRNQSSLENRVFNAGVLDNTQYRGISGLNYRRLLKNGVLDLTFGLNLSRFRFNQINENQEEYFNTEADEWEYSLKAQHTWVAARSLIIRSGLSAKFVLNENKTTFADTIYNRSGQRVPVSELGLPRESDYSDRIRKDAAFLELDWKVLQNLDINLGLRADHYPFIDKALYVAPRLALKLQIHPKHSIRLSGGVYHQSPAYVWLINPNNQSLRALKNRMGVLGWDFLPRKDLRISVEGYYKNYQDLPAGGIPGVNDYIIMTNTGTNYGGREDDFQSFGYFDLFSEGNGRAYGVEFLVQKRYSDIPIYGLMSLTLNKSRFEALNGNVYPGQYDQLVIFNLSGGYIFNARWQVSAKFRYFTGVPYTPVYRPTENPANPGTIVNLPDEYLSRRLEPGHHLDIRVDRFWTIGGVTLITYVDIQNVYDNKFQMIPTYDFWEDRIEDRGSIGILPSIGLSVEF